MNDDDIGSKFLLTVIGMSASVAVYHVTYCVILVIALLFANPAPVDAPDTGACEVIP